MMLLKHIRIRPAYKGDMPIVTVVVADEVLFAGHRIPLGDCLDWYAVPLPRLVPDDAVHVTATHPVNVEVHSQCST